MKVVIAGSSGLVGSALVPALRAAGHEVRRLVRQNPRRVGATANQLVADEIAWDPVAGVIDVAELSGVDAVINLAGENVGAGRWTSERRERILRSRVETTRTLVAAMSKMARKPAVFICASAVGYYGDRGDEILTETSGIGQGFLCEVCLAWETHAEGATRLGVRTVLLRFGTIFTNEGGALAKTLPLFRLGLGGRWGSGRQWMSWISLEDVLGVVLHALADPRCAGPINVVSPTAVMNAEFATTLAHVLGRPAIVPTPAWALRLVLGRQLANEAVLGSTRVAPQRLSEVGYRFRYPMLEVALRHTLGK